MIEQKIIKNKIILSSIIFAILLTTSCIPSIYSQRVLETYENEKYGIKIQYPPNWETREYTNMADEKGEAVVEIHPLGKNEPFISLLVKFLSPENATLKSFTERELKSVQKPFLENQEIKILNQNNSITLGGESAHKVVYESSFISSFDGKPELSKHMSMWTVLETEGYVLTFTTNDREQYNEYIKTAEKIMNSFKFTR